MNRIRMIAAAVLCMQMLLLTCIFSAAQAEVNPDEVMDRYLATEIRSDMTDVEKVQKLTEIVARDFDYAEGCSRWEKMVQQGSGDCWASARFIIEGCRRLGITAYPNKEFDSNDPVSLHRYAIAETEDGLAFGEAGYSGAKPRHYESGLNCQIGYWYDGTGMTATYLMKRKQDMAISAKEIELVTEPYSNRRFTAVGDGFAENAEAVRAYRLGDDITTIGARAFKNNPALSRINMPAALASIGEEAFAGCASLSEIRIPANDVRIGDRAFADCGALTVYLPATVTSISAGAFAGTDVNLVVPEGSYAEQYCRDNGLPYTRADGSVMDPCSLHGHTEEIIPAVEGSCTKNGRTEGKKCSVCGVILEKQAIIPAGHTWELQNVDGASVYVCSVCGIRRDEAASDPNRLKGDVNQDGVVDGRDAVRLMKYFAQEIDETTGTLYEINASNADMNDDGYISEVDLIRLVKMTAGEEE